MRASLVIIASLILGATLGVGITWARYGSSTSADALRVASVDDSALSTPTNNSAGAAKVSVDAEEFDFGPIENDSVVSHKFRFTNRGTVPLTLKAGGTTCQKCTIAEIAHDTIAPDESVDVVVQYTAGPSTPKFRQSATILTNDPDRSRVELSVTGSITAILGVEPTQLTFSKLSVHDSGTLTARLLNHITDTLNIVSHEWSDKSTEAFVDVDFKPLDEEALKKANAKSGLLVSVTIKPGLPLGAFRQKLTLTTDLPGNRTVDLDVQATIASDISLTGGGWNDADGYLHIGPILSKDGAKRTVRVLIHGPFRNDVDLKVGEVSPSLLKVSLGEKTSINDSVVQYPLTIEIPKGSPSANHLGSKIGKMARIILETTHPEAKQIKVPVRFAIEQ